MNPYAPWNEYWYQKDYHHSDCHDYHDYHDCHCVCVQETFSTSMILTGVFENYFYELRPLLLSMSRLKDCDYDYVSVLVPLQFFSFCP